MDNNVLFIFWLIISYFSGAIPWSVWLGYLFYGIDPRNQPDGNPGAANVFRAAGWKSGIVILIMDFLKAFVPVVIAFRGLHFESNQLFWIALAPTFGHAFSLFLRFRGGRALVTWFGVWTALTLYTVPLIMGAAALIGAVLFKQGEVRALVLPIALLTYLVITNAPLWMVLLALAQLAILASKIGVFYLSNHLSKRQAA